MDDVGTALKTSEECRAALDSLIEDASRTEGNGINVLKGTLEAQFNSASLDLSNMVHEAIIQAANRTPGFSGTSSGGKVRRKQVSIIDVLSLCCRRRVTWSLLWISVNSPTRSKNTYRAIYQVSLLSVSKT